MDMDSDQLSLIAIIVAAISAIVSFLSYWVSRNALRIEQQRENRYLQDLDCELIKGIHVNADDNSIIYIFIILINNQSSSNKSIIETTLNILYTDRDNYNRTIILNHDPDLANKFNIEDYEFAPTNTFLNGHESRTLGFIFESNKRLIKENYIDLFRIMIKDNFGNKASVDSILTTNYQIDTDNEATN